MKTLIFFVLSLGLALQLHAQLEIERSVIAAGGHWKEVGGFEMAGTIGEMITTTAISINGTVILTQGFQQPVDGTVSIDDPISILMDYNIYPNPTPDWIYVELSTEKPIEVELGVYDMNGRETGVEPQSNMIRGTWETQMDLSILPEGLYLLGIKSTSGEWLKVFKVAKAR